MKVCILKTFFKINGFRITRKSFCVADGLITLYDIGKEKVFA